MYPGAPPPPRWIAHHLPKSARDNTGWVHGHALLAAEVYAPPPCSQILYRTFFGYISNKSQKDLDDLMGEPPGFFLHTRASFTHPLVKIGI